MNYDAPTNAPIRAFHIGNNRFCTNCLTQQFSFFVRKDNKIFMIFPITVTKIGKSALPGSALRIHRLIKPQHLCDSSNLGTSSTISQKEVASVLIIPTSGILSQLLWKSLMRLPNLMKGSTLFSTSKCREVFTLSTPAENLC